MQHYKALIFFTAEDVHKIFFKNHYAVLVPVPDTGRADGPQSPHMAFHNATAAYMSTKEERETWNGDKEMGKARNNDTSYVL